MRSEVDCESQKLNSSICREPTWQSLKASVTVQSYGCGDELTRAK